VRGEGASPWRARVAGARGRAAAAWRPPAVGTRPVRLGSGVGELGAFSGGLRCAAVRCAAVRCAQPGPAPDGGDEGGLERGRGGQKDSGDDGVSPTAFGPHSHARTVGCGALRESDADCHLRAEFRLETGLWLAGVTEGHAHVGMCHVRAAAAVAVSPAPGACAPLNAPNSVSRRQWTESAHERESTAVR